MNQTIQESTVTTYPVVNAAPYGLFKIDLWKDLTTGNVTIALIPTTETGEVVELSIAEAGDLTNQLQEAVLLAEELTPIGVYPVDLGPLNAA